MDARLRREAEGIDDLLLRLLALIDDLDTEVGELRADAEKSNVALVDLRDELDAAREALEAKERTP